MSSDYTEDREILNTRNMLEDSFLANLKNPEIAAKIAKSRPIEESTEISQDSHRLSSDLNTENILLSLYDVRDGLIDTFKKLDVNSRLASDLTDNIKRVGSCINNCGGKVEEFHPLDYVSGLKSPNFNKNAERVIETTKSCYSLGKIEESSVENDTIYMTFSGKEKVDGKEGFRVHIASGTIKANKGWIGNEALDYIYTPGGGKLSVKAFSGDAWHDHSDDYSITWELQEGWESDDEVLRTQANTDKKEELPKQVQNNLIQNDIDLSELNDDFIIEEK